MSKGLDSESALDSKSAQADVVRININEEEDQKGAKVYEEMGIRRVKPRIKSTE